MSLTLSPLEQKLVDAGTLKMEDLEGAQAVAESIPAKSRKRRSGIYNTILACMAEGSPDKPISKQSILRVLIAIHGANDRKGKYRPERFNCYFLPSSLDQGKEMKDHLWVKGHTVEGDEVKGYWLKEVYEARCRMEHEAANPQAAE